MPGGGLTSVHAPVRAPADDVPARSGAAAGVAIIDQRYVAATEQVFLLKQKVMSVSGAFLAAHGCSTPPHLLSDPAGHAR